MNTTEQAMEDKLKLVLKGMYVNDQVGGYVPLDLDQEDFNKLLDFTLALLKEAKVEGEYNLIRQLEKYTMKMDDNYGEFECLDDIEEHLRTRAKALQSTDGKAQQ